MSFQSDYWQICACAEFIMHLKKSILLYDDLKNQYRQTQFEEKKKVDEGTDKNQKLIVM